MARGLRWAGGLAAAVVVVVTIPSTGAVASNPPAGALNAVNGGFNVDDPIWVDPDHLPFVQPTEWSIGQLYDVYENLFRGPGDPQSRRATNINTLGEVPDSSWFTNRLGRRRLSVEELRKGPNDSGAPISELFTVVGRPEGGITPKFLVEDVSGQRFVFKFDPMSNPEMASAAEMICSRFFHAVGYNVPEIYIVDLHKDQLRIADGAVFTNELGETTEITYEDLDHWMGNAPADENGVYRVLASKFVPGVNVGEFRFYGTRPDDPNDIFDHEHRRELRAYRVFSAWLNHDDSRATNTYDVFVGDGERGHIRHYLLDFGSCLGSASVGPNKPRGGHEYFLEKGPFLKSMLTLGLWRRPWLDIDAPDFPAVGNIEARRFDPASWKPEYPNAAFERLDAADAFWGARIVSRFTDDLVRAAIDAAAISDPAAAAYLLDTLLERRDRVVRHWLIASNPLDDFEVVGSSSGATLQWANAAETVGIANAADGYDIRWMSYDNDRGAELDLAAESTSRAPRSAVPPSAWGPADQMGDRYARVRIGTLHATFPHWSLAVVVTLRDRHGALSVAGIERPRQFAGRSS